MFQYFLRRLMMMIPTVFGITLLSFLIINMAPGGPVEQKLVQLRFGGAGGAATETGVPQEVVEALKKQYGFDKPIHVRYWIWLKNLASLDFGESFSYEEPAIEVIASKFPISLQFGVVSLILTYLICIPLGVAKAVRDGTRFDMTTSVMLMVAYSILPLILGILLRTFFAGGAFLDWFPLGGAYSDDYYTLDFWGRIWDRVHHFILPMA